MIEPERDEAGTERKSASQTGLRAERSRTVRRLLNVGPSPIAVSAFAAGLVTGVLVGVLWAKR